MRKPVAVLIAATCIEMLAGCSGMASQRATCKLVIQAANSELPAVGQKVNAFARQHAFGAVQLGVAQPPGTDIVGIGHPMVRYFLGPPGEPTHALVFLYGLRGGDPKEVVRAAEALVDHLNVLPLIQPVRLQIVQRPPFVADASSCVLAPLG